MVWERGDADCLWRRLQASQKALVKRVVLNGFLDVDFQQPVDPDRLAQDYHMD